MLQLAAMATPMRYCFTLAAAAVQITQAQPQVQPIALSPAAKPPTGASRPVPHNFPSLAFEKSSFYEYAGMHPLSLLFLLSSSNNPNREFHPPKHLFQRPHQHPPREGRSALVYTHRRHILRRRPLQCKPESRGCKAQSTESKWWTMGI